MKSLVTYIAVFLAGVLSMGMLAWLGVFSSSAENLGSTFRAEQAPQEQPVVDSPDPSTESDQVVAQTAVAEELTLIADLRRNTFVTVSGTVVELRDEDEFVLADDTGEVEVWLEDLLVPLTQGQDVIVRGFVDDDVFLEIYAQEILLADGSTLTPSLRGN